METRRLGAQGPEVSVVGFGAWAIGGRNWGPTDDEVSREALRAALDEGVTLIDTADVYGFGHSEELIGEVLRERGREGVVIATKAGNDFYSADEKDDQGYGPIRKNYDRDYLVSACEQSLRRLGVDMIDILQLHSPDLDLLRTDGPWEALNRLKRDGKIRYAGLSIQSFKETEQASVLDEHPGALDVLQVRYNLLEREAEDVLFPKAMEHGVGVIVRIPLLFGLLTGKFTRDTRFVGDDHRRFNLAPEKLDGYLADLDAMRPLYDQYEDQTMAQVSLRFCISHPACGTVIPGAKTRQQVADNAAAGTLGRIPDGEIPPLPPTH